MNCVRIVLCIILSVSSACQAMKKEKSQRTDLFDTLHLDFAKLHNETGVVRGASEANNILAHSKETKDVLRPLLNEMTRQAPLLVDHEKDVTDQLKGFFTAYALILYKYNKNNPEKPLKLDEKIFNTKMTEFAAGAHKSKQKSRKELVTFLTASLKDKNLF